MIAPTLQTDRLILRALKSSDALGIQRYFPHWNIVQHLSTNVPWPYPTDGAKYFVEEASRATRSDEKMFWALTVKGSDDECVGVIEYIIKDRGIGNRGFWLAEHLQGCGLMTEAIEAMQDYIFFDLQVEKIRVGNSPQNPASRRIKEKTGGIYIGTATLSHHSGCNTVEFWEITGERLGSATGVRSLCVENTN